MIPTAPRLRVAMDARSFANPIPRGMDRYVLGLVPELTKLGVEITLLHLENQPPHKEHDLSSCKTLALPGRDGWRWEQFSVPRWLKREKFDLYHAPFEHGVPLQCPCPALLTLHSVTRQSYENLIKTKQLSGSLEEYLGEKAKFRWRDAIYWKAQVRRANRILVPSQFCRTEAEQLLKLPSNRIQTTPLAVGPEFSRDRQDPKSALSEWKDKIRPPYLIYVGGFEPHKNPQGLIEAFAWIRQSLPQLSLVMVGSGAVPVGLMDLTRSLDLIPNQDVIFLSATTNQLINLLDHAELFVSLSWRESFGLSALEAMSRGLTPVVSSWGAATEVIANAGKLVDPRDHQKFAQTTISLLNTDQTPRQQQAKQQAKQFSWTQTARLTLDAYLGAG